MSTIDLDGVPGLSSPDGLKVNRIDNQSATNISYGNLDKNTV